MPLKASAFDLHAVQVLTKADTGDNNPTIKLARILDYSKAQKDGGQASSVARRRGQKDEVSILPPARGCKKRAVDGIAN